MLIETLLPKIWCDVSRKSTNTRKEGVKECRISSTFTLNFETKDVLSERARVYLESSSIFWYFCCFWLQNNRKTVISFR